MSHPVDPDMLDACARDLAERLEELPREAWYALARTALLFLAEQPHILDLLLRLFTVPAKETPCSRPAL